MKITRRRKINIQTDNGIFAIELQTWDNGPGYTVRVLKLPEVITEGSSIQDAKKMAREAINLCLDKKEYEYSSNIKSKRSSSTAVTPRI